MIGIAKVSSMILLLAFCFLSPSATDAAGPLKSKPGAGANDRAGQKKFHCWRLEQKNAFFGDCTVYAGPEALKIVFKNGKWINIATAPDWELFILNPGQKIYCHTPLDKWKANSVQFGVIDSSSNEAVRTPHMGHIAGLAAVEMLSKPVKGHVGGGVFWVARDLHLPDQISHVLCCDCFAPQLHALPLRISLSGGALQTALDTTSCSTVDVSKEFFTVPKDYKLAAHPEEVMNAGIMDVVKDMTGL